jgi:4-amino-4-deoxychorismate lyase
VNPGLAGIKHLNRLDQVLARNEWQADGIAEGLMLDPTQRIIEGTMSNLFVVKAGCLFTPDLSQAGIAGIMREIVMDVAAEAGVPCTVTSMTLAELARADELFLCNSIIGIWPVQHLVDTVFEAPGPLTATLGAMLGRSSWS